MVGISEENEKRQKKDMYITNSLLAMEFRGLIVMDLVYTG